LPNLVIKEVLMRKYKDIDRDSNIEAYDIGADYIIIRFNNGKRDYTYTNTTAGRTNVETAKRLAENGEGLNSHINRNMKNLYVK